VIPLLCALLFQAPRAQPPAVFHVESRLVVVDVTVHGAGGALVPNLDRTAFKVYENGKPQPIAIFMGDNVPVSVGIVIDNSGSMRDRRSRVEAAALAFARASNPKDEMFVVNFADKARVDVPFTSDERALEAGVARVDAIGGTALRDAIDLAETYLVEHATRDRKVILVITDGNDNASMVSSDQVRKRAELHDIAVYAIGLPHRNPSTAAHARHELDDLTESTGGIARHVATIDEADGTAVEMAREIRQRYTVAYSPVNAALDGSYRKIRVVVKAPEHVTVRTRAGYFATPDIAEGRGR
jgi:Ca-activated chloride channel family protein